MTIWYLARYTVGVRAVLLFLLLVSIVGFLFLVPHVAYFEQIGLLSDEHLPELPPMTELKAIYLTSNTALNPLRINVIIALIKSTELNAVVIDIKDGQELQLNDAMRRLVRRLRFAGIYPIARLPVFQHNGFAERYPKLALKTSSGALWRDSGGRYWLDPASKEAWRIILEEARQAARFGFAEINLDYVRFPSDGRLEGAIYPAWDKQRLRAAVINEFAQYMRDGLKKEYPEVKISADVFGYLLLRDDDQGIGQSVTDLAKIFDFIYPMVYPSHFDPGNFNFDNPAAHPYEVVRQSLAKGKVIFEKHQTPFENIRVWIQDFNLGAMYTPEMVRDQMRAVTDSGLRQGWSVWNPNNQYHKEIFLHTP